MASSTSAARALGQHDAELLLSYLTVPYLRIPLVVSFFATDDRIHSLQAPKLQKLLDAVLFEPGNHLPLDSAGLEPVDVPTSAPTLLGTPHHLLLNELCRSPDTLLAACSRLAGRRSTSTRARSCSSTTTIILYVTASRRASTTSSRSCSPTTASTHDSIVGKPYRASSSRPGARLSARALEARRAELHAAHTLLWGELRRSLLRVVLQARARGRGGMTTTTLLDAPRGTCATSTRTCC